MVLSRDEVARLFQELDEPLRLIAVLLYGAGLRLSECLELRVKDLDVGRGQISVRSPKEAAEGREACGLTKKGFVSREAATQSWVGRNPGTGVAIGVLIACQRVTPMP